MTTLDIRHHRLTNQLLLNGNVKTPEGVVGHLGAIQAQDYSGGEWSIGLRLPGSTIVDVERAIAEGEVVRTWAMRGTLHFLAGSDIRWILDLLAPGIIAGLGRRYKELELDPATFRKTNSILAKTLGGSKHLTRGELKAIIERNGISCEGQRMTFILHRASLDKVICFGVTRDKQQTHALFDEMVPMPKPKLREDSLAELARRYFTSHGPATLQDYMWWSGLSAADAKAGLDSVKHGLAAQDVAVKTYWMPMESVTLKPTNPIIHLLPPFDDFLLGYKDRSASVETAAARQLRGGGMPDSTIIIDGRVVGTWNKTSEKSAVFVETSLFTKLRGPEKNVFSTSVKRYAEFTGKKWDSRKHGNC